MENSVTPSLPAPPPHYWHVWCGCLCIWLLRVCGQLVFVFTFKEPWIQEGEDGNWPQS